MKDIPSCLRLIPGEEELVMALFPAAELPKTMDIAAISLSAWMNTRLLAGMCAAIYAVNSFWGVIG